MKTPEGKVKDKVKALLTEFGAYQFWPVQTGYGKRTLDCLACYCGRFIAIETKRAGKDLTPFQKNTRAEIENAPSKGTVFRVRDDAELAVLARCLHRIRVDAMGLV